MRATVAPAGPYPREDILQQRLDDALAQLEAVKALANERALAYQRDREAMRAEYEKRASAEGSAAAAVEAQLADTQRKLMQLTKGTLPLLLVLFLLR